MVPPRVLRLDGGDLLRARLEAVGDLVQDLGAVGLARARPRPSSKALRAASMARCVSLRLGARDARPRLLGGGVDGVRGLATLRVAELPVDVELVLLHG